MRVWSEGFGLSPERVYTVSRDPGGEKSIVAANFLIRGSKASHGGGAPQPRAAAQPGARTQECIPERTFKTRRRASALGRGVNVAGSTTGGAFDLGRNPLDREAKMSLKYSQRSLIVLSLLGILSAVMSVLSVILIFQLRSPVKESPRSASVIPDYIWPVLPPVCAVLSALSLSLHLSSVVVCLLHGYFSTEVCRGEQDADR